MYKPWIQRYDPGVPSQLEYPDITAFHYLDAAAEKYPDKACTIYRDQSITFAEMRRLADGLAGGVENLGVKWGTGWASSCPIFHSLFWPIMGC